MPRFFVLLRGVNAGPAKRVSMAAFKRVLEALGCTQVCTLLNSGNAVVTTPVRSAAKFAQTVSDALASELGVSTPVIVKTAAELANVIDRSLVVPPVSERSQCLVVFAQTPGALQPLAALHAKVMPTERFKVTPDAAYLHCPAGLTPSRIASALMKPSDPPRTARNWATVLKLRELLEQP